MAHQSALPSPLSVEPADPSPRRRAPLIWLVGLPRSGTSWLGKIFDSHPDTLYRHEADARHALGAMPLVPPVDGAARYADIVERFVDGLPALSAVKVAGSLPIFPKRYYTPLQFAAHRVMIMAAVVGSRTIGPSRVPPLVRLPLAEDIRLVWKSVESLGRVGAIVRSGRVDRTLVIVRHPCGQIASVLRGERLRRFEASAPSSGDYGVLEALLTTPGARARGLTIEHLRSLHPVERLAWRWVLFHEKAFADVARRSSCRIVRHEDVCADPLREARALLEFGGLDWTRQTAEFVRSSTATNSGRYYSLRKDPALAASAWRSELSPRDAERVRGVVQESFLRELYRI